MIYSILLLSSLVPPNTLSVVSSETVPGASYVYTIAGVDGGASTGMELSNKTSNYSIGEFLSDLPDGPNGAKIDWDRTYSAIINDKSVYKQKLYCVDNPKDDTQRLLFTQGGAIAITWYFDGVEEGEERVYQIAESSSERPNRLYWSNAPFLGPQIDLTGKFVKLYGNSELLKQTIEVNETAHTTNVIAGIEIIVSGQSKILSAKSRLIDEEHDVYEGPIGQFVLAYYTDGNFTKFIGSVVVEVGPPSTKLLTAHVGDELLPTGDGWAIKGLLPYPKNSSDGGVAGTEGDTAAPHLLRGRFTENKSGDTVYLAYAVSPNDKTTRGYSEDSPTKNDIFWEKPDFTGTLWPFEEDIYSVTWNPDDPCVVCSGDAKNQGVAIHLPVNYNVSLCDYQDPSMTASVNSNVVTVSKAGRFTIKLTSKDPEVSNIWFLPMRSKLRTDPEVVNAEASYDIEYPVGYELDVLSTDFAGSASNAYLQVDREIPGYIYESASLGKNWNPRLYHEPKPPSLLGDAATQPSGNADPFEKLDSSIYSVATNANPIEVWWRAKRSVSSRLFGDTQPIIYPAAVQRYRIRPARGDEVHDITLASKLGSSGKAMTSSSGSFRFSTQDAGAELIDGDLFELPQRGFEISADMIPNPGNAEEIPMTIGRILTVYLDNAVIMVDHSSTVGVTSREKADIGVRIFCYDDNAERTGILSDKFSVPREQWTHFSLKVDNEESETRVSISFGDDVRSYDKLFDCGEYLTGLVRMLQIGGTTGLFAGIASTGMAIDNLKISDGAVSLANWTFESETIDEDKLIYGSTAFRRVLRPHGNPTILPFGASVETVDSGLPYNDEVVPEIYRQTDSGAIGYHRNLAHAFTRLGDVDGSYVAWALRDDLADPLSEGLVFAMYSDGGKGAQKTYRVVDTNEFYKVLESETTVSHQFLPPAPLCYLDGYWNDKTSWSTIVSNVTDNANDPAIVYRDRKLNDWARRDGAGYVFYYYKPRSDFDWPHGKKVDEFMPWLDRGTNLPAPWKWISRWPEDDKIPTMKVAETLTKEAHGLPEVWNMLSCGVIYPKRGLKNDSMQTDIVDLVDPSVAQTAALEIKTSIPGDYGFTVGSSGTCLLRNGKYYFTGLPPSISDRFYIDTNADQSKNMILVGRLVEPALGRPYLQINVLSSEERQAIKDICKNADETHKRMWDAAVDKLATELVLPSQEFEETTNWSEQYTVKGEKLDYRAAYRPMYQPVDHYAMMASGNGAGYVVFIENDSKDEAVVPTGNPIDVKIVKVLPELYNGSIMPLLDSMNKLSEQLTIQYNEPFGAATDNFIFEWRRKTPEADGTINTNFGSWPLYRTQNGLTSFTLGGTGTTLSELVNTYYVMRYRAKEETAAAKTCGTGWSEFTDYTLAEGWVQRVLNAVTPFNQRLSDFYENEAEIRYTMLEQIGKPYDGDVALNDANLNEIGLLQLYRTVLSKAEKMSLDLDVNDVDVNKQLLLATSRIADLYMLLGAEAYADAKNPLISTGLSDQYVDQLKTMPSSTFCFQNQMRTLLDEELALLRGRDNAVQNPNMKTTPIYNRLIWNFTKGITEGEVAYVNNYGIRPAANGDVTVDAAAAQYPQGHGDAYGHYLSAIKGYYNLLRNPNFGWSAGMMEMMISAGVVNMDYQDEQKFADAAVKFAQTGLDVVDLTARKAWRDNGNDMCSGYFDGSEAENFGYGEFASRAGLGAAYNWLTINSILPTNGAPESVYYDKGIKLVTRETTTQLDELVDLYGQLEDKVNRLDSGLNPLGLSQNTIPMDIDPADLDNRASHFEQILARAEKALENCETTLKWANEYGSRLKQLQNAETTAIANQEAQELAYKNELIALYGTPFPGDIGPSGTYVQGYDGPDLYHYMWMDLDEFGLSAEKLKSEKKEVTLDFKMWNKDNILVSGTVSKNTDDIIKTKATVKLKYEIAANGIVLPAVEKPGKRAMEGSIQSAYREYLTAFVAYDGARSAYDSDLSGCTDNIKRSIELFNKKFNVKVSKETIKSAVNAVEEGVLWAKFIEKEKNVIADTTISNAMTTVKAIPDPIFGLAVSADTKAIAYAALAGPIVAHDLSKAFARTGLDIAEHTLQTAQKAVDIIFNATDADLALAEARESLVGTIKSQLSTVNSSISALRDAEIVLQSAEANYRAEIAKGDQLQKERATWRARVAGDAAQIRYLDMFARVERNNALTKYSTAYDTAQRYVWELAKVYDYETGLLSSDPQAAAKFYAEIIGSRQLGYKGIATSAATDKGLYDIVHRLKENYSVLKPRLGINNPDQTVKEFSLRYELMRIDPGVRGDDAWKLALRKYWVDDINADVDFRRICQPLASEGGPLKEPGLIIPFSTTIDTAKNFFGRNLQGGDHAYSSADYATKIAKVGISLVGYEKLTTQSAEGLAADPNVYLVPAGIDYLRAPTPKRQVLGYKVVDQVLPLPYTIGTTELDDESYISTFSGLDGTSDSAAKIRRHSTLVADGSTYATRLVGRSVWNDKWLLVIPAASLNANRTEGLETFIKGVSDIKVGIKAYSRAGN